MATDPADKCRRVDALFQAKVLPPWPSPGPGRVPGRPERPIRVAPSAVPNRGIGSVQGRAALVHAVAHIEFNAINLALDAADRFSGLPEDYYRDWISVAHDESRHFRLLEARLHQLGHEYGDFAAHDGLWDAAEKTAHDPLLRMALVPRVLEARGLDVTPGMIRRLKIVGDSDTAAILELILQEEVRHVAIGTHWFRFFCADRGLEPAETFRGLLVEHGVKLHPPLNLEARAAAGFLDLELQ